jgi:hypothetical protein
VPERIYIYMHFFQVGLRYPILFWILSLAEIHA